MTFSLDVPPDLAVNCERNDVDNVLVDLFDDAFRFARSDAGADRVGATCCIADPSWMRATNAFTGLSPSDLVCSNEAEA